MKTNYVLAALLLAASGWVVADAPFTVSADGTEVADGKTGLIWRRCAEGMTASAGSCSGAAIIFSHEAALTRARDQAASAGVAWRLPNVKELASIADRSKSNPAIDSVAFPGTPTVIWFWSSSPNVGNANYAWGVNFGNDGGPLSVIGVLRSGEGLVRLVRAGQ